MKRSVQAMRLHLLTWHTLVAWPWGIVLAAFAVNLLIFGTIGDQGQDENTTGGLVSIYVVVFASSVQLIVQALPFALGISLTRRAFYLGTGMLVLAQALLFGAGLTLCRLLEDATGGWGMSLRFFGLPFAALDNPVLQVVVFGAPFLLVGFAGMLAGTVYQRWGTNGVFGMILGSIVGVGGLVALASWWELWGAVGNWFAAQSTVALLVGWPALLAAVLAGAGFVTIRRATT